MSSILLWSGGFDSTFRLLDRLSQGDTVPTLYLDQENEHCWQKQRREKRARQLLLSHLPPSWRGRVVDLPPVRLFSQSEILEAGEKETLRQMELYRDIGISAQLPYICAVAQKYGPVEACFLKTDKTPKHYRQTLEEFPLLLPLIHSSKEDMIQEASRKDIAELLDFTWSCEGYEDILGGCGQCHSCLDRIIAPNTELLIET